ncbi:MAG: A/G-specific adenine glycosylase [Syntrophaceae bacterium]|nr:A/G-specific adenine glycosylase [Syntrophaceae bacterium]
MPEKTCVCTPPPGSVTFPVAGLLSWYGVHHRRLPWRETKDPYRVWLSEIMLQQTQVATVIPYYKRFLERFPTLADLARAEEEDVLKAWENLGYYSRARQLHHAAKILIEKFGGHVPARQEDLVKLPGIGAYTAGAILSIAFGQAVVAIDGNVRRVLCRFFALDDVLPDKNGDRRLADIMTPFLPLRQAGEFNQGLMELGATVCRSRKPLCSECPLSGNCLAHTGGDPESYPARRQKKSISVRQAVAAIIRDERGRVLVVKRQTGGLLGGLWKFPGGFCDAGEEPNDALRRTLREEVGIPIGTETYLALVRHAYTHFRLSLHVFSVKALNPQQGKLNGMHSRWIYPGEIKDLPLSKADRLVAGHGGLL